MKCQHHVIYVPGIGDDVWYIQSTLVRFWRLYGVRGHCFVMPWLGSENFEPKLQRLCKQIDRYSAEGHRVSLIGASAGAGAVLNAYVLRQSKVSGLVYVCAKINRPETVSERTYAANPAFKTSLQVLQQNLPKLTAADKTKLRSYYSRADQLVSHDMTVIPGVKESRLPPLRHAAAILASLSFEAPKILYRLGKLPLAS